MEVLTQYIVENPLIIVAAIIALFIWNLLLTLKVSGLKKKFNIFSKGGNIETLEEVIVEYNNEIDQMKKNITSNTHSVKAIFEKINVLKGNVGIVRYNAFGEEGNDLSYSIAILDENKDGIVISSIYNRGESNTYAKPIIGGNSHYKLSQEEIQVIEKVMK